MEQPNSVPDDVSLPIEVPATSTTAISGGRCPRSSLEMEQPNSVPDDVSLPIEIPATSTTAISGGRSPRSSLEVEQPNSVPDIDVSLPIEVPASSTTAESSHAPPPPAHPMPVDLGMQVPGFALTMITGLLFNQHQGLTQMQSSEIAMAISVGFTTTCTSLLLRGRCSRVASALEFVGVTIIFGAFFGMVSSFLPSRLVWACWLCWCCLSVSFLLCLVLPPPVDK